jgi:two-component system, response regulator PdtaR
MRRVLVIDDHEPSRKTLIDTLSQGGYQIAGEGATGNTAVALATTTAPDVVLMAVGLPDVDGIQAARNIMRAKPVPIVLITSHYDATTVERATKSGAMGYLIKPLRDREVTPAIELAISRFQDVVSLQEENETLKENLEGRKVIERAKGMLMEQKALTEEQAYSLIKKASMNMRKPMVDVADFDHRYRSAQQHALRFDRRGTGR